MLVRHQERECETESGSKGFSRVFEDVDGNGEYEPEDGETPLSGWEMCLETNWFDEWSDENIWYLLYDDETSCKLTGLDGYVWWDVPAGEAEYYIYEKISGEQWDDGWRQTWPSYEGGYYAGVDGEEVEYWTDYDGNYDKAWFGNTQYAIHALKFFDTIPNNHQPSVLNQIFPWLSLLLGCPCVAEGRHPSVTFEGLWPCP